MLLARLSQRPLPHTSPCMWGVELGVNRHILFGNFSPTVGGSFVEISRIIQIKAFRLYKKTTNKECGKHRRRKYRE